MSCTHLAEFRRQIRHTSVGRVNTSPRAGQQGLGVIIDERASAGFDQLLGEFDSLEQQEHNVEDTGLNHSSDSADHYVVVCTACDDKDAQ